MGLFPIFSPPLMVMFGPDYYNYLLYKKHFPFMSEREKGFFKASHKIIKGGLVESLAEFEEGDTVLGGLLRIEAKLGPIKQLQRIRDECKWKKEFLEEEVEKNPLMILKRPENLSETIFKTVHKLYTKGSSEALKNIAASIYYGRVAASSTANAYYIPGVEEVTTYKKCLEKLCSEPTDITNFDEHIKFLYPRSSEYDSFINLEEPKLDFAPRNPFEIQTVHSLHTHKVHTKLNMSVPSILEALWMNKRVKEGEESLFRRDCDIIMTFFPLIRQSLKETLDQFSGDPKDKLKGLLMLILKLYSLRDRVFKGVVYGNSSSDLIRTYENLIELNSSISYRTKLTGDSAKLIGRAPSYENLYLAHNQHILSFFSDVQPERMIWETIDESILNVFLMDNNINRNTKKRVFMAAASFGFVPNIEQWTRKTGLILHQWIVRQKYSSGTYEGDFKLLIYSGTDQLMIEKYSGKYFFKKNSDLNDPEKLWLFFNEFMDILQVKWEEIQRNTSGGQFHIENNKVIRSVDRLGFNINNMRVVEEVSFEGCSLDVDESRTTLVVDETKIFSIETGLLNTYATCGAEFDFIVFNMKFSDLCDMSVFNQNFSLLYKDRSYYLKYLNDLTVTKPKILQSIKERLRLTDWDEVDRFPEEKESFGLDDFSSFIPELLNIEVDSSIIRDGDVGIMDEVIDFLIDSEVVNSMQTTHKLQHTRRIFKIVQNIKYDIICYQVLLDLKLNYHIIRTVSNIFSNGRKRMILYSLISLYNRMNVAGPSPRNIDLSLNPDFVEKFDLVTKEDDILF